MATRKSRSAARGSTRSGVYFGGKGLTSGQRKIGKQSGPKGRRYYGGRGLTRSQRKVR